ncbi:MAG TPA: hypothetical protein VKW78_07840 [Terriglobales bacterium]|nr:hypothetical protein [Terriglobales bacterium]
MAELLWMSTLRSFLIDQVIYPAVSDGNLPVASAGGHEKHVNIPFDGLIQIYARDKYRQVLL